MVDVHRVADRLGDLRVHWPRVAARHVEHCEAGAGCDPLDLDVATRRQRVSGVDEGGEVIGLPSLRSDDARCAERLASVGWGAGAEPAEVPVVEDDVLPACSNQVRKVHVDAVGDDPDLDAGAVGDLLCGVDVHHVSRLRLDQRHDRIARADLLRGRQRKHAVLAMDGT